MKSVYVEAVYLEANIFWLLNYDFYCIYSCMLSHNVLFRFSTEIRGGFMLKQIDFQKINMRANIMEGNQYAANAAAAYGFDV